MCMPRGLVRAVALHKGLRPAQGGGKAKCVIPVHRAGCAARPYQAVAGLGSIELSRYGMGPFCGSDEAPSRTSLRMGLVTELASFLAQSCACAQRGIRSASATSSSINPPLTLNGLAIWTFSLGMSLPLRILSN